MFKKRLFLGFVSLIGVWAFFGMAPTEAKTSVFSQQILAIDCILTTVNNGSQQVVGDCPAERPEVIEVGATASGARFIRGTYDSSKTVLFKLTFRGVTYTANTANSPLTLSGDIWTFALDELTPLVEEGSYTLLLEAVTIDGDTITNSVVVQIESRSSGQPDPGFVPLPTQPGAPRTSGGSTLLPVLDNSDVASSELQQAERLPRMLAYDFGKNLAQSMLLPIALSAWILPLLIVGLAMLLRSVLIQLLVLFVHRRRKK
jgi:hypothetical protein